MRNINFNNEIKYLDHKENLKFILSSLFITWIWVIISIVIDKENDRGLITLIGFSLIFSLVLSVFFSKKKLLDFFITLFLLISFGFLTFIISLIPNFYLMHITGIDWIGFIIPTILTGLSFFFIIRLIFSFPNNIKAFTYIFLIPIVIILCLCVLPFYDNIFAHDTGIGLIIGIYLTCLFLILSLLCRKKKHTTPYKKHRVV